MVVIAPQGGGAKRMNTETGDAKQSWKDGDPGKQVMPAKSKSWTTTHFAADGIFAIPYQEQWADTFRNWDSILGEACAPH